MEKYNINSYVRVKLTDVGKDIYIKKQEELNRSYRNLNLTFELEPDLDYEGYWKAQLWIVMSLFGSSMYAGCDPPFATDIILLSDKE
jgi:hypothetical protein